MSMTCMDLWAVWPEMLLAALALLLVSIVGFLRGHGEALSFVIAGIGLVAAMVLAVHSLDGPRATAFCGTYAVDAFAVLYKLLILCGALIGLAMLAAHFRAHPNAKQVPIMLLFMTIGAMGLVSSLDLTLILLFFQLASAGAYLLVCAVRSDVGAQEATLKFFIYGAVALAVMAYGLSFLYGLTGRLDLPGIALSLSQADRAWLLVACGLVLAGYAFEITLVPFHMWVPDTYQGATAPAAGLISVVPKIAAFAALLRLLLEALPAAESAWSVSLAVLAVATMSLGNFAALRQRSLKRLLAYSSIAQAGYVLIAVAVAGRSAQALPAIGFYLAAYLLMNLGAFAVVAQLERTYGTDDRDAARGLIRRSPWEASVLALALLSLAGIPPLAGFAGKVLLLAAAIDGGMTWLAIIAAINMAIGLYYYARIIADMFFVSANALPRLEASIGSYTAGVVTALGTLALGVAPGAALEWIERASVLHGN